MGTLHLPRLLPAVVIRGKANWVERSLLVAGGLLVIAPINALDLVGVGLALAALALQFIRRRVPVSA